jgi:hypothetical protein
MMWAAGFDSIDRKPPEWFERLARVRKIAAEYKLELIPTGFNTGYAGSLLSRDRNLAEGLPVKGALFIAGEGEARFSPETTIALKNGDTVKLKPYREYRLTGKIRGEGRGFSIRANTRNGRNLLWYQGDLKPEWQEISGGFNSWFEEEPTIVVSRGEATDLRIEEVGLVNVLRREGTPVRVRDEKTGQVYEEGRDYAEITDPQLNSRFDHDGPAIGIPSGSRIKPGDRLRVDYYHSVRIYRSQVSACPADPRIFEIWKQQFPLIEKHLEPRRYFLSFDEVRVAGHCETCQKAKQSASMAEILGGVITRVYGMIRDVNPKAEIFIWSDMLDPNHNSRPDYYLVDGDVTGTWKYVPKDLRICTWYYQRRDKSLAHFSSLGFKTLAGAYYDADDLENPKGWLESLDRTPGAMGIMYTTWENKYRLLADFGDLVSKR